MHVDISAASANYVDVVNEQVGMLSVSLSGDVR